MADTTVIYHHEQGSWWAESPDVDGFTAVAGTFGELRALVREGLEFYLDDLEPTIREFTERGAPLLDATHFTAPGAPLWTTSLVDNSVLLPMGSQAATPVRVGGLEDARVA
ncbi:MAG: type II toxin-antitoxin system HicB family antitoxin [Cellulomonadaceae bacterium]|nr:type II toxin-antitoxin system HicB family antitoxin [Cellulomonadaceae bacterium]